MALTAADIVAGKPTKEEIFSDIDTILDDHETRISAVEGTSRVDLFNIKYTGDVSLYSGTELDNLAPTYKAPVNLNITSFVITLLEASTSGTLALDLEKSTDNGVTFNSILTGTVDVTGTTVGSTSGTVTFTSNAINQNELVRIRISGIQVDQGTFHVSIYGEVS